jgi:hypothetical protein
MKNINETKYITIVRDVYTPTTTLGKLYLEGVGEFCYTLEDNVRPYGIKLKGITAIPENHSGYKIGIHRSNKFKRDVLILYTESDRITLKHGGISFTHVYFHGGNTHVDTDGCILVAANRDDKNLRIQGTKEAELFKIVKEWLSKGIDVYVIIQNKPYTNVPQTI